MYKSLGICGAIVAALAVSSAAPATGDGGHDDEGSDSIEVMSTDTEEAFLDLGEPDLSLGDEFVFSSELTQDDTPVGHTGVVCTITSVEMAESQCVGIAWLDDSGQITVQGLIADEPEVFELAITGGTGAYEGAGGTLEVQTLSETEELLTFNLTG